MEADSGIRESELRVDDGVGANNLLMARFAAELSEAYRNNDLSQRFTT
jgi:hypothetical protein